MKIGYQGKKYCYSYNLIFNKINSNLNVKPIGYKNFSSIFEDLLNNKIDLGLIPIENCNGGNVKSLSSNGMINYDFFYNYNNNIRILCEFDYEINHSLYCLKDSSLDQLKTIISHPQALAQVSNFLKENNLNSKNCWDTAGSVEEIMNLNDKTIGCIAPPNLDLNYNIKVLKKNISNNSKNITRFYLIQNNNQKFKLVYPENNIVKFSASIKLHNHIGSLGDFLIEIKKSNIDLTKIESKNISNNNKIFDYIFYLEGYGKLPKKIKNVDILCFGEFPIINSNLLICKENYISIGIIGFGRFGQFLAKEFVKYGWRVYVTSRKNYIQEATNIGAEYKNFINFNKLDLDVLLISTSILSFNTIVNKIDFNNFKDSIIVDVLSVKQYPKEILLKYVNKNLIFTHPMFGPDSAKNSWKNLNFVYEKYNIDKNVVATKFLNFWKYMECNMIEMSCEKHDKFTANSQFLTHLTGRILDYSKIKLTPVDTNGFKLLYQLTQNTVNDSWELFEGLAKFNSKTKESLNNFKFSLHNIENKIFPNNFKESSTGIHFKKIKELQKTKNIINCGIGIPSWEPPNNLTKNFPSTYTSNYGLTSTRNKILNKFYNGGNLENIILTPGAKQALYYSIKLLTKPGSKWIIFIPNWVSYKQIIKINNGDYIEYNFNENYKKLEEILKEEKINGIIISNPNNPTGFYYDENIINNLITITSKYKKFIINDEVYMPLIKKMNYYESEYYISISSMSKKYGIPGWRLGWIVANKKYIDQISVLQSNIASCPSHPSMHLVNELIDNNWEPNLTNLKNSRIVIGNLLNSKLKKYGKVIIPKNISMYLFFIAKQNIDELINELLEKGLAVMPGKDFGIKNSFRMTLNNNIDILNKMINIIDSF